MAIIYENTYQKLLTRRVTGPCPDYTDETWATIEVMNKASLSNPKDTRVRPLDFLDSLTPLAKQYTYTRTPRRDIIISSFQKWAFCPEKTLGYKDTTAYLFNHIPSGITAHAVDTNWETAMRLKIKNQAVNLSSLIVEYRQTCEMFRDTAMAIFNGVRRIRRGKSPFKRKLVTKDISSTYIGYSYGVAPLVGDLFDSWIALQTRLGLPIYHPFYVKRKTMVDPGSMYDSTRDVAGRVVTSQTAKVYVKYTPEAPRFTPGNPAEWIWEAIPFSFVIDWLIPIGDVLSALDALASVDELKGTLTTRIDSRLLYGLTSSEKSQGYIHVEDGEEIYKSHVREVISTIPLPDFPRYEPSTSLRAVANGLALLHILASGGKSRIR